MLKEKIDDIDFYHNSCFNIQNGGRKTWQLLISYSLQVWDPTEAKELEYLYNHPGEHQAR